MNSSTELDACLFVVLSAQAFSVPSHMSMSSGSEDEADSQSLVDEGEASDSFKTLYSFPKIHNPAVRRVKGGSLL